MHIKADVSFESMAIWQLIFHLTIFEPSHTFLLYLNCKDSSQFKISVQNFTIHYEHSEASKKLIENPKFYASFCFNIYKHSSWSVGLCT